jgi:O-antigen chain-terminating methyltransferase
MRETNIHPPGLGKAGLKKINVEEIMQNISNGVIMTNNASCTHTGEPQPLSLHLPKKEAFQPSDQYEVNDFNIYDDKEFIENVYKGVLKRSPEPDGMDFYLDALRSGKRTKTEILSTFRFSSEGRKQNVKILGIKKRFLPTAIYRIPLLGYLVKTVVTLLTLPLLLKQQNHNTAVIQQLQEKNNKLFLQLENATNLKTDRAELNHKADKTELDSKADKTELNLKADKTELDSKADKTELSLKADKTELDSKADKTDLGYKADKTELALYLQTVNYAKDYLSLVQQNLNNLINEAKKRLPTELNTNEIKTIIQEEEHTLDAMYVAFEDRFRGSREEIKERVSIYLPYLEKVLQTTDNAPVLDVGCGRGEWLELLQENEINAQGLDLNRIMVASCQQMGLDVIESDVVAYLKNIDSNSLSVISGFHIIEHLPFKVLIQLYDEALRVLKPGGMVIFETPNPENLIVGACNFYTDPTHINPIPPSTAQFILEARGFLKCAIIRLHKNDDPIIVNSESPLKVFFTNPQDYAIIGYKH